MGRRVAQRRAARALDRVRRVQSCLEGELQAQPAVLRAVLGRPGRRFGRGGQAQGATVQLRAEQFAHLGRGEFAFGEPAPPRRGPQIRDRDALDMRAIGQLGHDGVRQVGGLDPGARRGRRSSQERDGQKAQAQCRRPRLPAHVPVPFPWLRGPAAPTRTP